jgi:hypothetical protein
MANFSENPLIFRDLVASVVTCCHPRRLEQNARDFIQFRTSAAPEPAIQ